MPLKPGGMLKLGIQNLIPASVEPYMFGTVEKDSVEPFNLEQSPIIVDVIEPFNLEGGVAVDSIEPFWLGEYIVVDSVEPFTLADAATGYIGVNSPASPILGWWDR